MSGRRNPSLSHFFFFSLLCLFLPPFSFPPSNGDQPSPIVSLPLSDQPSSLPSSAPQRQPTRGTFFFHGVHIVSLFLPTSHRNRRCPRIDGSSYVDRRKGIFLIGEV